MIALAPALVDLVFRGGRYTSLDAAQTAAYFALFSVSLCLWSAQAIYARAFYAAGNTLVPMLAGTIVTVVSLPIYALLYRWHGTPGLAIASDIGIALQTLSLAVLLHQRRMVSLASLDYRELGRCLTTSIAAGAAVWAATLASAHWSPRPSLMDRPRSTPHRICAMAPDSRLAPRPPRLRPAKSHPEAPPPLAGDIR